MKFKKRNKKRDLKDNKFNYKKPNNNNKEKLY